MVNKEARVLIVDDEQVVCDVLHDELSERGYVCTTVVSANEALSKLATENFEVVLLDIRLPGMSGMELLRKISSRHHNTAAIMITGVNNINTAVESIKLGALDYVVKPFDLDRVTSSIRAALDDKKHQLEGKHYKTTSYVSCKEIYEETAREYFGQIAAVAYGVEAKLDAFDSHSKRVTQRTVDVARQLDIPEAEIQRWAAARSMTYSERNEAIKSSLSKLERSPLMQSILGMTELYMRTPKSSELQN